MWKRIVPMLAIGIAAYGQSPATLSGTVVDAATNKPIARAFVSATATNLPPLRLTVQSASDGSFSFSQLPPGAYYLCLAPSAEGHLDPCVWSPPPATVNLAAGQNSSGYVLKAAPGAIITIHVADPQGLLQQKTAAGVLPDFTLGVITPQTTLRPARQAAVSPSGIDYQVTIPFEADVVISLKSFSLQIADGGGAALADSTARQTVNQPSGASSQLALTYSVTGLAQ